MGELLEANDNIITPFKSRELLLDKHVTVYRNLNFKKQKVYSIKQNGQVKAHSSALFLRDCSFFVNQKGIDRIRKRKSREVVAYISGYITPSLCGITAKSNLPCKILFNPYKYNSFIDIENENELKGAQFMVFNQNGSTGAYTY